MQLRIIGAGWAGLAAAVAACQRGWSVTLYEASHQAGGRARALPHDGDAFDNGQHILIGAYSATLDLMRTVGVDAASQLLRTPLDLRDLHGHGLHLPDLPPPWNLLLGVGRAQGWSWRDRWALLRAATRWQIDGFTCPDDWSVARLCQAHGLNDALVQGLIEPLCLSALNTSLAQASASVFLRVLRDALLSGRGGADLLLPRTDLSTLLVTPALRWLHAHGARVVVGERVTADTVQAWWHEADAPHPLLLAVPSREAARLCQNLAPAWAQRAAQLESRAIATVYLHVDDPDFAGLPRPMLALRSDAQSPAQFVFCRQQLGGQPRSLAAVVSDCTLERDALQTQVCAQLRDQLGLRALRVRQTRIERHATFACTPGLQRPSAQIGPHQWACGDYIDGPYPATLEGAVRSGQQAVAQLAQVR